MNLRQSLMSKPILLNGVLLFVFGGIWLIGCFQTRNTMQSQGVNVALAWNQFILQAEVNTEGYRGPVAARTYGYVGLAAFEAARPGFAGNYNSMADRYKGLNMPTLPDSRHFDPALSLNACYALIIEKFFLSAPGNIKQNGKQLEEDWVKKLSRGVDSLTYNTSIGYGRRIAEAVFNWSATDSLGHTANHHNYDRNYIPPVGDGLWKTSPYFPMPPLLPYWGEVRPFVIQKEAYIAKQLPPYTKQANQLYYIQAMELISLSKPLSSENQWIAEFWNDDRPGLTFSPAGHWLAIANQVIEKENPPLEKALETYMKVGFGLADAMIACFNAKYIYNLERPETFIQKYIDPDWRPFSPSPPFPSYPSGHSMMGAAVAEILKDLYGDPYTLRDRSHEGLEDFMVKPRKFSSFDEMARENAISRVYLGVHWRFDCEEGLRLGKLIGEEVNGIKVEKELIE